MKLYFLYFFILLPLTIYSQNKVWDKSFGGSDYESLSKIIESQNGGFLGIGNSSSGANGNKDSGNNGGTDIWLVKFDVNGNKLWDKTFGGSLNEYGSSIIELSDGSLILFGTKTISNVYPRNEDYYVIKVSENGTLIWQNTYGGSGRDVGKSITKDLNGNFYLFGESDSPVSGQKSEDILGVGLNDEDYWVLKINSSGIKIWDHEFGFLNHQDFAGNCIWTNDNSLVIFGSSWDNSGGTYRKMNYSTVKINSSGTEIWKKNILIVTSGHLYPGNVVEDDGGNYIINGSQIFDNFSLLYRGYYSHFVKIDSNGNTLWKINKAGKSFDLITEGQNIIAATGKIQESYIIPNSGGATDKIFDYSYSVFNSNGILQGETAFSTQDSDYASVICKINSGGFLLGGYTSNGTSKDKSQSSYGGSDWWILKIKNENCSSSTSLSGLEISTENNKSINANWNVNLLNIANYQWRYKNINDLNWSATTNSTQFFGVQNIPSGQTYHYQVKAVCNNGQQTPWVTSPSIYLRNEVPVIDYPTSVSTNELSAGGNIQVKGSKFTPYGNVTLEVRGISGFGQDYNFTADASGVFTQLVYVTSVMQSGKYTIKGIDYGVSSGARIAATTSITGTPANKVLEFNVNLTPNLVSLTIPFAKFDESNLHVNFFWRDFISVIPPYNTYLNAQGKRRVKYKIELGKEVTPGNITWIQTQPFIDRYEKPSESKLFYEKIFPITSLSAGKYVVRVTDELKTTNTLTSLPFDFIPISPSISITKHWDYTYPDLRNGAINSVAADGVSRLYFKTLIGNNAVTKVKVELMDENNSTTPLPSLLGKLKVATNITSWSDEANDANQKSIFINSKIGDSFWCWYVAPENFADGNLTNSSVYSYKAKRTVKVKVTGYSSTNVEIISKTEELNIVRPPLYMVHGLGGLGGANGTWDDFKFEDNFGNKNLYVTNSNNFFPIVFSPQMRATATHEVNSNILLSSESVINDYGRSFQSNIYTLRKAGILVTNFDYIAHSMGGCMLRAAIDDKQGRFYSNKNYGKGYAHKFITLTTPHNGSPLGDIVTELAKPQYVTGLAEVLQNHLGDKLEVFFELEKYSAGYVGESLFENIKTRIVGPTPAVKAFSMANSRDGIKFLGVSKTKSHVIASNYIEGSSGQAISNLDGNLLKAGENKAGLIALAYILNKAALNKEIGNSLIYNKLKSFDYLLGVGEGSYTNADKTADFMNYYAGVLVPEMANYLLSSDIIVPLSSQLAGLPISASNVTHNKIGAGGNYLNFKANHNFLPDKICDNDIVGNRVFQLLNADVNSSLFGDLNASPYYGAGTSNFANLDLGESAKGINSIATPLIESRRVLSRARIDSPQGQTPITFGIESQIKTYVHDTTKLISSKIIIGNEILSLPKANANTTSYLFDNIGLGKQKIYLEAVYSYGLDSLITYWDSVSININNASTPQSLALNQQDIYIFKGDTLSLNLGLNFSTYSGNINTKNTEVGLVSSNNVIAKIASGTKEVIALDTGYVMLTYTYKGLSINQFVTVLNKQLLCKYSPALISHTNSILSGEYDAKETINSRVNVPTNTYYYAGKSIILTPGFSAGSNETFLAEIRKCNDLEIATTVGLVAYYPFDGNANDVSGNGNNGVVTGPTLTVDRFGVNNKAYNFGGFSGSSIIRIPNSTTTQFANTFSISLWYYQNTYAGMNGYGNNVSNGYHMLFAKEADWGGFYAGVSSNVTTDSVYYNHTNKPNYSSVDYNVNAKSKGLTNNLNTWIHMTYTVENGVAKIFRNGVKIGEKILTQNVNLGTANTKDLFFGRYSSTWYPLNGKLDDIRVYNRALSDSEVSTIYNSEKP